MNEETLSLKLNEWLAVRQQLEILKPKEMFLRKQIVAEIFQDVADERQTQKICLIADNEVKAKQQFDLYWNQKEYLNVIDSVTPYEAELITWKASMSKRNYDKLPRSGVVLDSVIELRPAAPKLEIIA